MSELSFGQRGRALCPRHPEHAASRTCERCGNFMCGLCSEDGTRALCPACRERSGLSAAFPLDRSNWSVGALLDYSWTVFQREWVMVLVGLFIVFGGALAGQVLSTVLTSIGEATESTALSVLMLIAGTIASAVVQGLVTTGYMAMLMDVLNGQRADLGRVFSQFHKAVPYLTTTLLIYAIFVPVILLIFGGAVVTAMATGLLAGVDLSAEAIEAMKPEDFVRMFTAAGASLVVTLSVAFLLYLAVMVWLGLPVLLMPLELARSESPTAMGVLRRCFAYAKGERLGMVGATLLGSLIILVGGVLCCLPVIPAVGLFYVMLAGLYLSLRNGANVD